MAQTVSQPKRPAPAAEQASVPKAQTPPAPVPAAARPVTRATGARRARSEDYQPADTEDFELPRVSHVRILPTSLPYVHDQLMEQRDREQKAREQLLAERRQEAARADPGAPEQGLSQEDQALTARALKPHSRSVVDLDKLRFEPPIGHPITQQPKKSRKWQFGIRSRNQPYEAMLYLYRAIAAQGGLWDIKPVESGMVSSYFPKDNHANLLKARILDLMQHPPLISQSLCRANTPISPQITTSPVTPGSFVLVF